MTKLVLSERDRQLLGGEYGKAARFAMETVVTAARVDQADSLINISFAHIDACFYNGRAHLDFVRYLLQHDAKLAVPTWTNNGLVSLNDLSVRDPSASNEMREAMLLMESYVKLGCRPVWTCAPYQLPGRPELGAHIVGSESNAVSFYNSVVGARTNKYGDYLDVCAAITGRVPNSGLHKTENRAAEIIIELNRIPPSIRSSDLFYHLLGHLIGLKSGKKVPVIQDLPSTCHEDDLKAISAACSSSGSVPLFHAVGITPEANTLEIACQGEETQNIIELTTEDLRHARTHLGKTTSSKLRGVAIGTPHFSYTEIERLFELLGGRSIHPDIVFYLTTSRHVYQQASERGWIDSMKDAGIYVITDTCTYFSPAIKGLEGCVMTNSAKWAYYAPGMLPVEAVLGSLQECVESAVSGKIQLDTWGEI